MGKIKVGVIGGSGLYELEGLTRVKCKGVKTPFGEPSDEYHIGKFGDTEVVFLARHGKGHRILPTEINYCANIYGFKALGVERIISFGTVGSLKENIKPLDFVIVDQFVDRTNQARRYTFFGEGVCAHISFAEPVCSELARLIYESGKGLGLAIHPKGTYLNMEGPAFSTKAESNLYRQWGMDVIGMTNMAEARLAREAEVCYATIALVTDYDCWHQTEEAVTTEMILSNLRKNVSNAKKLLTKVIPLVSKTKTCSCGTALKGAVITSKEYMPAKAKRKLELIIKKYIR